MPKTPEQPTAAALHRPADLILEALAEPRLVRRISTGRPGIMLGWWRTPDGRAVFAAIASGAVCVPVADIDTAPAKES
jgi:hypothetical protein